jgi:hypothetical protein
MASFIQSSKISRSEYQWTYELLVDQIDQWHQHGCNDYFLADTPEHREFISQAVAHWGQSSNEGLASQKVGEKEDLYVPDYITLDYCAYLCQKILIDSRWQHSEGGSSPQLAPFQLRIIGKLLRELARNEENVYETEPGEESYPLDLNGSDGELCRAILSYYGKDELLQDKGGADEVYVFTTDVLTYLANRFESQEAE